MTSKQIQDTGKRTKMSKSRKFSAEMHAALVDFGVEVSADACDRCVHSVESLAPVVKKKSNIY